MSIVYDEVRNRNVDTDYEELTDFNLSDNWHGGHDQTYYLEEDVKEFIKRLKEGLKHFPIVNYKEICEFIDKLAGEKLI